MAGPDATPASLSDVLKTYPGQTVIVGPDTGMPQTLAPQERVDTQSAAKRRAEDDWFAYMAANGSTETGGKVYKLQKTGDDPDLAQSIRDRIANAGPTTDITELKKQLAIAEGEVKAVYDPAGQDVYNQVVIQSALLDREKADAKAAAAGIGAARSYLDTENDKTAEITRQLKDFENRASNLYSLQDSEQQYGMRADDQNAANNKAMAAGLLPPGETYVYGHQRPGDVMSQILAPSLPSYVSPDYRLNAAVGLPGIEGFNDPQYDANGLPLPQYAFGTNSDFKPWRQPHEYSVGIT